VKKQIRLKHQTESKLMSGQVQELGRANLELQPRTPIEPALGDLLVTRRVEEEAGDRETLPN
jgi:hypothetical protein